MLWPWEGKSSLALDAVLESIALEVERVQLVGLRKLISRGSQVSCGLTVGFQNQKAREIAVHAAGGASNDRTGAAASIYEVQGLSCWDVYGPVTHEFFFTRIFPAKT